MCLDYNIRATNHKRVKAGGKLERDRIHRLDTHIHAHTNVRTSITHCLYAYKKISPTSDNESNYLNESTKNNALRHFLMPSIQRMK